MSTRFWVMAKNWGLTLLGGPLLGGQGDSNPLSRKFFKGLKPHFPIGKGGIKFFSGRGCEAPWSPP